ncbi:hypothetical protein BLOT_016200 [Blomia tropicalis]|nr:hypothetical protein BLOT_016200 [Blomia tropicalis]
MPSIRTLMCNVMLTIQLLAQSQLYSIVLANCTANCVNERREWPQFNFEFYDEHSGDGEPPNPTEVTYSIVSTLPGAQDHFPTLSLNITPTSVTLKPIETSTIRSSLTTTNELVTIESTKVLEHDSISNTKNCVDHINTSSVVSNLSQNYLSNYLLRSTFKNGNQTNGNLTQNFTDQIQDQLQLIYEYALEKQREQLTNTRRLFRRQISTLQSSGNNNSLVNLTIWDIQSDQTLKTIDVVYYIQRNGILIPYDDANKIMSFVSNDYIYNETGLEVVHKIRRYIEEEWTGQSVNFSWLNLYLFIILSILLILCLITVLLLYMKHRKDKQKWLETIHKELSRAKPKRTRSNESVKEEEIEDQSHWNYGMDDDDDEYDEQQGRTYRTRNIETGPSSTMDKGIQYDYTARYITDAGSLSRSATTPGYYRERLIPIHNNTSPASDPEYDRISYIRTQETLKETKRHPNILEIQLSKETQSIVQEIRNELNRYNFKKIIEGNQETSSDA